MSFITWFIDFIIHLDQHLGWVVQNFGIWAYLILFFIIFCETGLVIFPFLPGDSLLFVIGTAAAIGTFHLGWVFLLLVAAAFLGDTANYWIGNYIGPKIFKYDSKLFNKNYLEYTKKFYKKHGGKTIIIARFFPVIRTFAPFLAGVGQMKYKRFISHNIIGGAAWVSLFLFLGYFFGNIPLIKNNFGITVIIIMILSLIPAVVEFIKYKIKKSKDDQNTKSGKKGKKQFHANFD